MLSLRSLLRRTCDDGRRCRCIELDCWDGPNNQPLIYHGHTLTTRIAFADAVKTINEYAFRTSDYPVILSIENHCSVPQQVVMVRVMSAVFGDRLIQAPLAENESALPSPEQLRFKILLKAKTIQTAGTAAVARPTVCGLTTALIYHQAPEITLRFILPHRARHGRGCGQRGRRGCRRRRGRRQLRQRRRERRERTVRDVAAAGGRAGVTDAAPRTIVVGRGG